MALFTISLTLITLPMTVLINRCIITPYLLPSTPTRTNFLTSLRLILTPDEFAKPWSLYLAPGLLVSTGLHAGWVTVVAAGVRKVLVSTEEDGESCHLSTGLVG